MKDKLTINDIRDIIIELIKYKLPDNLEFIIGENISIIRADERFQLDISLNQMFSLIRQGESNRVDSLEHLTSELLNIIDYRLVNENFYIFTGKTIIEKYGKNWDSCSCLHIHIKGRHWVLPIYDTKNCLNVIEEIKEHIIAIGYREELKK